jgi:hypothetical protein
MLTQQTVTHLRTLRLDGMAVDPHVGSTGGDVLRAAGGNVQPPLDRRFPPDRCRVFLHSRNEASQCILQFNVL